MMFKKITTLILVFLGPSIVLAQKKEGSRGASPRVVYPKKTTVDFDGLRLEGQLFQPGEFYFNYREKESFDSLVKRKPNFRKEMLRDVVLSK